MKASILLRTKFIIPPVSAEHLPRPHLIQWMEKNSDRRLILLSAPPGYGKTSLLSAVLVASPLPVAWFQLDPGDSDPTVFLTHLTEAFRRAPEVSPALGQATLTLLDSPDAVLEPRGSSGVGTGSAWRRIATVLVNELGETLKGPYILVLEDYHYIVNPEVHQLLDFLLENAPSELRFILSTRSDPPISLARLRARGLLAELRAADLRFRDEEVSALITRDVPGLSSQSLTLLTEKTEGWAAALQILRSSLSGRDPQSAGETIASLNGSNRFVFDYLAGEVFRSLPEPKQTFLLRTAILSQMDAAACAAVAGTAGKADAQSTLDELEGQNLFLSSLDPQRRWFRYHTLFHEFLLSTLHRKHPEQIAELEKKAGAYYEQHGEPEAAFRHYIAVPDQMAAARVALTFASDYAERGRSDALHRVLSTLSIETLRAHPELLLQDGNAHRHLGDAANAISAYEEARAAFANQDNPAGVSRTLTRLAEVHRAGGNYRFAETLARQAFESAPLNDHVARAEALMALA